jgi:HSP20 family protein
MSLIRWDPFADMAQLREQVNRLFEQNLPRTGHEPMSARTWAPAVDIHETESAIVLEVEMPGIKPEEIDIQIVGDTLTIKGERKMAKEAKEKHYVRIERAYGAFQRSFTLGLPIEQNGVRAACKDGILEITLPKAETVKPKQVRVEVQTEPATELEAK